jgi:hypothetical protein
MNRRRLILAAAASGALPLAAVRAQPRLVRMHAPAPVQVRGAPAEVAMTPWRNMPAVQATVEGKGPFTFGIDTGFPGLADVSDAVAQAAGLAVVGQAQVSDPSGRNPVTVNLYKTAALSVGPMVFSDVQTGGFALPRPPGGPALDGILGMGLFSAYTLVLDFKGRRVAVSSTGLPPADGATIFDFTPGGLIELNLSVGDKLLPAHLDTGQSRAPLVVPQKALAGLATRGEPRKVGEAHTVSQTIVMYAVAIDAPVRIGAVRFPVSEVSYPTVAAFANLGSAALQDMAVKIDQKAGRIQFVAG